VPLAAHGHAGQQQELNTLLLAVLAFKKTVLSNIMKGRRMAAFFNFEIFAALF
jgi:hypothetical protein